MGLFDDVAVHYPLPTGYEEFQDDIFQTKDLAVAMMVYTIDTKGKLLLHKGSGFATEWDRDEEVEKEPIFYHGDISLVTMRRLGEKPPFTFRDGSKAKRPSKSHGLFEIKARFTEGILSRWIIERDDFIGEFTPIETAPPFERERMEAVPGITFQSRYWNEYYRIPRIMGCGWTVAEAIRIADDREADKTGLSQENMQTALIYYGLYRDEVDGQIEEEDKRKKEFKERVREIRENYKEE